MSAEQKTQKDRCRNLRLKGFSLGEIVSLTHLPKTTAYDYIKDIILSKRQRAQIEFSKKQKIKNRPNTRKGRCTPGRSIFRPTSWSNELIHIVAHFMFDGRVEKDGCRYYSKDEYQVKHVKELAHTLLGITPLYKLRDDGVKVLSFHNVELADYVRYKKREMLNYVKNGASKNQKRTFLRAFFDDEGNVYYNKDTRRVRGYQKSYLILDLVKRLLEEFGIFGRINKHNTEIEISKKDNLIKFAKEINFSHRIYINPMRKNSIWKRRIEKRKILELAISSYGIKK